MQTITKNIKKAAIPLAALSLIATGAVSTYAYQSHAQTANDAAITQSSREGKADHMESLVKAISEKFGLNQTEVQQVFDDQHAQMQQQHQADEANRLSQAVTGGKLTQDQADKINEKRAELKQWATDNNIPAGFLPFGGGRGHGGPDGMRGGMGDRMNEMMK